MKSSQNKTALLLMVVSLLLLATSQWFWLKSEYKEHKRSFYSNSDLLFKETVRGLEDSLISKMVTNVFFKKDDHEPKKSPKKTTKKLHLEHLSDVKHIEVSDTIKERKFIVKGFRLPKDSLSSPVVSDSLLQHILIVTQKQSLQDSLERLKRIISQLPRISIQTEHDHTEEEAPKQWSRRRFNFLSAARDSVDLAFNSKIKGLGYDVAFVIEKDTIPFDTTLRRNMRASEMHRKLRTKQDSIVVNNVRVLNPEMVSSYSVVPTVIFRATPQKLNDYLFSKLRNNAIFSGFLLLLTGITFFIIYRNLQRQSRLNSLKNDLISNITHELKTPLSTLSVALEALQQFGAQANPKTTKEYLEISQNEVQRLSQMVDNILKTSLLEKQGLSLNPLIVNLEIITETLVKSWQPRFNQLKGTLLLETTDVDFTIEADESQITSILNNLLDNAIKYCKVNPHVSIHLKGEPSSVTMTIKDNGIGIPKEYQNQVFDKFFRVPTGDRHNVKGYGLGLNFVKHIMDLHRGLVTLESDPSGTMFTLTFKRKIQ